MANRHWNKYFFLLQVSLIFFEYHTSRWISYTAGKRQGPWFNNLYGIEEKNYETWKGKIKQAFSDFKRNLQQYLFVKLSVLPKTQKILMNLVVWFYPRPMYPGKYGNTHICPFKKKTVLQTPIWGHAGRQIRVNARTGSYHT